MKCAGCGVDIPEESAFCPACGRKTDGSAKNRSDQPMSRCPSCGRSIQPEFMACPYCGLSFVPGYATAPAAFISSGKRIGLYLLSILIPLAGLIVGAMYLSKKDDVSKHVGTICLVLGVVSIVVIAPIASSAILYLMVLDFGGSNGTMTPQATYSQSTITNGKKVTILSLTVDNVPWDDITVVLKDSGTGSVSWLPVKEDLNDVAGDSMNYTGKALGSLTVAMWAFDNIGNGLVDGGDYVTFFTYGGATAFSGAYSVQFLYEPTGDQIGNTVTWTS